MIVPQIIIALLLGSAFVAAPIKMAIDINKTEDQRQQELLCLESEDDDACDDVEEKPKKKVPVKTPAKKQR
jgi:hypothetical protein